VSAPVLNYPGTLNLLDLETIEEKTLKEALISRLERK
jgi:hypothetical protein